MRKKFNICVVYFLIFISIFQSTCFAGTDINSTDYEQGGNVQYWTGSGNKVASLTCTTYLLEYQNADGSWSKINSQYKITHAMTGILTANGNLARTTGLKLAEELAGYKEDVFLGSSCGNMVRLIKGGQLFEYPANSGKESYSGKYRYVVNWHFADAGATVYASNMGLTENDIKTLITIIENRAKTLKDQDTINIINSIKSGYINFCIRVEPKLAVGMHKYNDSIKLDSGYMNINIISGTWTMLTCLEFDYAQYQYKNDLKDGYSFGSTSVGYVRDIRSGIWIDASTEDGKMHLDRLDLNSAAGYDYVEFDNPYEFQPNTVTEICLSETTSKELTAAKKTDLVSGEETTFYCVSGEDKKAFGANYQYTGMTVTANGEMIKPEDDEKIKINDNTYRTDEKDTETTITGDGKGYSIIYWYKQQAQVKIIGVPVDVSEDGKTGKTMNGDFLYEKTIEDLYDIPIKNKKVSKQSFENSECYEILGNNVIYGTHYYSGEDISITNLNKQSDKNNAVLNVEETSTAPTQILVVFYYKPLYTITVEHKYFNPITNKIDENPLAGPNPFPVVLKKQNTRSSQSFSKDGKKCINYDVKLVSVDRKTKVETEVAFTTNGLQRYSRDPYSVSFYGGEYDYKLTFYYTHQYANVTHKITPSGSVIKGPDKIILEDNITKLTTHPGNGNKLIYQYYELNAGGQITSNPPAPLSILPGQEKQDIILYYKQTIPPTEESGFGRPVVCYPEMPEVLELDNSFTIKIPNNGLHPYADDNGYLTPSGESGSSARWNTFYAAEKHIRFPFDVYYNGAIKAAGTDICVASGNNVTKTEFTFTLPVWVEDNRNDYEVEFWVVPKGGSSLEAQEKYNKFTDEASGNATNKMTVKVIGKIYDFTVTSILGDDMWEGMLKLPSVKNPAGEYKADRLAIGQEGQRTNTKWNYGIMRGTRVFFSVNTKGRANTAIKLVPTFYHIDAEGNKTLVDAYTKNASGIYEKITENITLQRTSSLSKFTNERTAEFNREKNDFAISLYKSEGIDYTATKSIGNYGKILLDTSFRVPYVAYLTSDEAKLWDTEAKKVDILKSVSHWYGDYTLPADVRFTAKGVAASEAEFNKYQTGYILMMFKINSQSNNSDYLLYSTDVWENENVDKIMEMPKTSIKGDSISVDISSYINDMGPVVIYGNKSTTQNYDTAGTH